MREALADGDYRAARSLAQGVLRNEQTPPPARAEAELVLAATQVPGYALATGLVAAAVVLALCLFVALRAG